MLRLEKFQGKQLEPYIEALGALRIMVFQDYPYLYEGSLEYEHDYLKIYVECPRSLVVLAFQGRAVVGATTCMPLADEDEVFKAPFLQAEQDVNQVCYLGESVLLQPYRGQGVGKRFFELREKHARYLNLTRTAFCAVDRPDDHPLKPKNYCPLDSFWTNQGYAKQPELQTTLSWKEPKDIEESGKTMTFWTKDL